MSTPLHQCQTWAKYLIPWFLDTGKIGPILFAPVACP